MSHSAVACFNNNFVGKTVCISPFCNVSNLFSYRNGRSLSENLINAFEETFNLGAIPVINENDAVAIEEIVYGDNDSLSAIVAKLIGADALLILTDIDGLYTGNPNEDEYARIIPVVTEITDELYKIAGGKGSKFGTGGMVTKLHAAEIATEAGIDTIVLNGGDAENIYRVLEGHQVGTFFVAKESKQLELE